MNAQRILAVIQKEWWEIVRDPLTLVMAFVVPMALLLLVGFGMTFDVENIPLAIQDRDGSAMSRDYAYRFIGSRYFDFKGFLSGERDAIPLLADGKLRAVIIVPEQFERDLLAGRPASVQVLLDGAFPDRTRVTKGYISAITRAASLDSLADYLSRTQGVSLAQASQTLQPVSLEVRYLYNQSLKSDWSVPPKLLMFILFFTPAFMTSLRVVREKELGTILNIYTSPLTRMEFVVAKLAPYVGIAMVNLIAMWLVVMSVFGVPFKGSVPLFLGASLLYVIATTSIGMLVSVFVRTQIAAMLISLFITFVPALQYSGLEIPIASMGLDAQVIAHLMPAMYYTRIIDGSFLKGVGVSVLWPDIAMLAAYAAALAGACYLFFHKRVRM
jgi:ABC-2 type transport system permease protein/ribosome-dependent ATPase